MNHQGALFQLAFKLYLNINNIKIKIIIVIHVYGSDPKHINFSTIHFIFKKMTSRHREWALFGWKLSSDTFYRYTVFDQQ